MTSLNFWLLWSALCLGLWGCGWTVSVVWRRRRENGTISPIVTPSIQIKQKARTALTNMAKIALGVVLGMAAISLWEYRNTYVVANAVIDRQQGNYVTYHFEHDYRRPRQIYAWKFCDDYVPDFEPHQIVETMIYVRKHGCESVGPYKAGLRLRRNQFGVPIIEEEGGEE